MFNYYNVAKEINPMRNAVKRAEQVKTKIFLHCPKQAPVVCLNVLFCQELSKAQKDLAKVKKELTELAETLDRLNVDLKVNMTSTFPCFSSAKTDFSKWH